MKVGIPRLVLSFIALGLVLAACTGGTATPAATSKPAATAAPKAAANGSKPTVRVGSTNFSEQLVLAELYSQILEANGYTIERRFNLGNREIVAPALESGQIDMYPEYLATYVVFITKDTSKATTDAETTFRNLQAALEPKNLTVLDYAPAVDTNGFVVLKETADRYGLKTLSDIAAKANNQLILGGPAECPTRPFCQEGLERVYNIQFKEFKALDSGGPITIAALQGKQIDVAVLFTTNAAIQQNGFVLLEDDKHLQLADNVAPVVRNDLLAKAGDDFKPLINSISKQMTTAELTDLNKQVDIDKKDPRDVAAAWLKAKGLVK